MEGMAHMTMDWEESPTPAPSRGPESDAGDSPALLLSHDELRHIFQFVPELDRWALQPVCSTWAAVGASCPLLVTSATIDAEEYAQRRGRSLDWQAACEWLRAGPAQRPTLSLRLTAGHHTMPAGGLYSLLPAIAATLRTLRIHLRAPALLSRDFVGLGRLAALTALHLDVAVTGEVLVMGLHELEPLARLRELSIDAVPSPPAAERQRSWMEDFPTPNYADQYPTDAIRASFGLNLASMPDLQSLRIVADPKMVQFDTAPPGLTLLTALTALHLNNCYKEWKEPRFGSMPQLERLSLEDFRFRTPKAAAGDATPAAAHPLTYFRGLDSLRALTLRHCRLDVDGVRLMASLLPQLQELDVGGNKKLEKQEGGEQLLSSLDAWWLRSYLSGRKRKSDQISRAGDADDGCSGSDGGGSPGSPANGMEVEA